MSLVIYFLNGQTLHFDKDEGELWDIGDKWITVMVTGKTKEGKCEVKETYMIPITSVAFLIIEKKRGDLK